MRSNNLLSNIGRITAYTCFTIGTVIFALYYFMPADALVDPALRFIVIAFWFNTLILLILLIQAVAYKKYRKENLITCLIMLLNIPATILCCWTILLI